MAKAFGRTRVPPYVGSELPLSAATPTHKPISAIVCMKDSGRGKTIAKLPSATGGRFKGVSHELGTISACATYMGKGWNAASRTRASGCDKRQVEDTGKHARCSRGCVAERFVAQAQACANRCCRSTMSR
jgi:hypothetical protein